MRAALNMCHRGAEMGTAWWPCRQAVLQAGPEAERIPSGLLLQIEGLRGGRCVQHEAFFLAEWLPCATEMVLP